MTPPPSSSRRSVLVGAAAAAVLAPRGFTVPARAADRPVLRVGTLPFGAVHWEIATVTDNGLDKAAGITVENVPLASNEAARIGFLSGSVDSIVTDLLFAARLRSEGRPVKFLPYSATEGSLMVKADSPIRSIADLRGKSLGVAGGTLDKSWLLLQAVAKKQGLDLTTQAKPVFGAPPLLSLKVENGELDAGLLYWTYSARLAAKGFRTLVTVEQLADTLGAKGAIAFVGFVFMDTLPEATLAGFGKAARRAETMMADDPAVWTKLRPLMKAPDDKTFVALKEAFKRGIPTKPLAVEVAQAKAFYATLAEIGGPALVGKATALPEGLYVDQKVYG